MTDLIDMRGIPFQMDFTSNPAMPRFWTISPLTVDTGFPERLRDCRKRMGLTQEQLGRRIGCDHSYISKLESGEIARPFPQTIQRLANVFRLQPNWLRGYADLRAEIAAMHDEQECAA